MKEVIFALFCMGTVSSWIVWGVLCCNPGYKQKARVLMISGTVTLVAAIGWAIRYGA